MRNIEKRLEPQSLATYRAGPYAHYGGLAQDKKNDIRASLLQEQGYICCYCMSRITVESMQIEHWHCQDHYEPEELDYGNMLATCPGNEGAPPPDQHCDQLKGNQALKFNPATRGHNVEARISYLGDGRIQSSDREFSDQIKKVLNLNWSRLRENRKHVIRAVLRVIRDKLKTQQQLEKEIGRWSTDTDGGKLEPFVGVIVFFLRRKLSTIGGNQ